MKLRRFLKNKPRSHHILLLTLSFFVSSSLIFGPKSKESPNEINGCDIYEQFNLPPTLSYAESARESVVALKKCLREASLTDCAKSKAIEFQQLNLLERELLSWESGAPPFYNQSEAALVISDENRAVLEAIPPGQKIEDLNGIDIGAGGSIVDENLIGVEPHRSVASIELPSNQQPNYKSLLSWAEDLPFADERLDLIVSRHNLEHLRDPITAIDHYLNKLRPGGGLGIVVPNVYFAWDPSSDDHPWGHRWNTDPVTICKLYRQHWSGKSDMIHLATTKHRVSFDFVLRKKGTFEQFKADEIPKYLTGKAKACNGEALTKWMPELANGLARKHNLNITRGGARPDCELLRT